MASDLLVLGTRGEGEGKEKLATITEPGDAQPNPDESCGDRKLV